MGVDHRSGGGSRQLSLPPVPASCRAAREFVRQACRDWRIDEDMCEDAALVATELVANVVDHARTSCALTVSRDDATLRIDVEDLYPSSIPEPWPVSLTARRGRGLQVIAALSTEWGVRERPGGKSVWAVLDNQ